MLVGAGWKLNIPVQDDFFARPAIEHDGILVFATKLSEQLECLIEALRAEGVEIEFSDKVPEGFGDSDILLSFGEDKELAVPDAK